MDPARGGSGGGDSSAPGRSDDDSGAATDSGWDSGEATRAQVEQKLLPVPGGAPVLAFAPATAEEIRRHAAVRARRLESRNVTVEERRAMMMRGGGEAASGRAHVSTCSCVECRHRRARRRRQPGRPRLQFRMNKSSIRVVMSTLLKQGFSETSKRHWNLMWTSAHLKSYEFQGLSRFQRVNQFPRSYEVTRKDSLCRNIMRMQALHGRRHFDFLPLSFILPADLDALRRAMAARPDGYWICKPVSAAQGKGIFVTQSIREVLDATAEDSLMVTEYIRRPLLLGGLKFDLRVYVAATSFRPLRVYVYREGLARFATAPYSEEPAALANRFMHLTNFSVNKHSDAFVDCEDEEAGSKQTLTALFRRLSADGHDVAALRRRIDDIVVKTMVSIEAQVNAAADMFVAHHENCFELFGFDILLDAALKPWLLEVNFAPSLNVEAALDLRVKAPLVADLFTLAGVPYFDAKRLQEPLRATANLGRPRNPLHGASGGRTASAGARPLAGDASGARARGLGLLHGMDPQERRAIRVAAEERRRAGGFRCVFPTELFFEEERPANTLLANYFFQQAAADAATDADADADAEADAGQGGGRDAPAAPGAHPTHHREAGRPPLAAGAGLAAARAARRRAPAASTAAPPVSPVHVEGAEDPPKLARMVKQDLKRRNQLLVMQRKHERSASAPRRPKQQ